MEQNTKHSLSILRHPDSAPMHLLCCVSDLSSIRVVNSLCCPFELKSLLVCVVVLSIRVLCVLLSSLTSMFLL
jgi:hypothetical protein